MSVRLAEIAQAVGGRLTGADVQVDGVSTDSRTVRPGELFVALRGPRFDGHAFVAHAAGRGAAAALVEEEAGGALPLVVVDDTRTALGRLGRWWRGRCGGPVVALTGSSGKTTVKELTAGILARTGPGIATAGNLNNAIGVPLTLCRIGPGHRWAVVELGASAPGEIADLAGLAMPDVGVVLNAGPAHLEGFGTVAGVARGKGELLEAVAARGGVAVYNADDAHAPLWRELAEGAREVVRFGLAADAEWTADWEPGPGGTRLRLRGPAGPLAECRFPLLGRHNVLNALAAAAAAAAAGAVEEAILAGLEAAAPVPGRLRPLSLPSGALLLDDTYNANPLSLEAGLEVLAALPGERVLVLGDMAELGADAASWHEAAGRRARAAGVTALYALGDEAARAARAFGPGGHAFADHEALAAALEGALGPGMSVLVKGSRRMRMERLVQRLAAGPAAPAANGEG